MKTHPHREDIETFLASLEGASDRGLVLHLLTCEACCRIAADTLARGGGERGRLLPFAPRGHREEIDAIVDRMVLHRAGDAVRERRQSRALFEELMRHPEGRRRTLIQNSHRFRTWSLAEHVLRESRRVAFESPREAARLVELALAIVDRLDPAIYGTRLLEDLSARAWAYLGNARRLASDLHGAEEAFRRGAEHLAGCGDPSEEAGFFHLLASLRKDQRRFGDASHLLRRASDIYRQICDNEHAARSLTSEASLHLDHGSPEKALPVLREALAQVEPENDPRTAMSIYHNLALCFAEMGNPLEAQRYLRYTKKYYLRFPDRLTALRARWLEGVIALGTGNFGEAEKLITEVRDSYLTDGTYFHAAIASLDLAMVYIQLGKGRELRELSEALIPILVCGEFGREALAAAAFFREAVEMERSSVEMVRRVAAFLRRSRHDARLRFSPNG